MTSPYALSALMHQYYGGSDGRTRHWANRRFIYTEGVKAVAEKAGCYWLLDIIATEVAPKCLQLWRDHEIGSFMFQMTVKDNRAKLRCNWSDNKPDIWSRDIDYTDFPEGEWAFELAMDGVVDAPNEVLVMLLLEEH